MKRSYCFLTIGKTQDSSTENQGGFKRYIGLGNVKIAAVNPTKAELDSIFGREMSEPTYTNTDADSKIANVTFVLQTVPEDCNGIEITQKVSFFLRNRPSYNRDETLVRVIDDYGNYIFIPKETAKAGVPYKSEKSLKFDCNKYHIACDGEHALVDFLKKFLRVEDAFNYVDGSWVKKANADETSVCLLENIKDYFNGDFSEIKSAIALQPNNRIKVLFGVRTAEGKHYQEIAKNPDFFLPPFATIKALNKAEQALTRIKQNNGYANTEYKICDLQEWEVAPTNLATPTEEPENDEMPW